MAFNVWGPAGTATEWSGAGGSEPQGYIAAGTGNGKGPSLGSLWGGAKQADKLGILGAGEKFLGGIFGGGGGLSTPKKADFAYGGQGEDFFGGWGQQLYNRAPVQANLDQFNQSRGLGMQSRGGIENQIATLRNLTKDDQASAAYRQMQAGGQQNMSQALALARAGGGSGAAQGAALRSAQMGNQTANAALNQQAGIMRAQENAQANQQISGLMAQQRAMDLQASGLDAQTAMQQAQLELGSQQLGQQGLLGMFGLGQNAAALEQKGLSDYWKTLLGAEAASMQAKNQGISALIGGGAALGAGLLSDIRGKMDVTPFGMNPGAGPMMGAGAQVAAGGQPGPAGPSVLQGYQQGAQIYGAFQPQGPAAQIQDPANYLPNFGMVDSDARAKKLETENSFLRQRIGEMGHALKVGGGAVTPLAPAAVDMAQSHIPPGQMRRLPMPTRPDPKSTVKDEAGAAEYGAKWLESNRVDAMRDAAAAQAYQERNRQAQAQLAERQNMYAQTGPVNENMLFGTPFPARPPAPPQYATTSDEHAKQRIQELEGMVASLSGGDRYMNLDDESNGSLPGPLGGPTFDTFMSVNRPRPSAARFPLAAQAEQIPARSWQYDPQHAASANAKNGLPPDDPFGHARKTGPMAQEIAQIPALSGAVSQGPDGMLQVDGGQAAMTGLSMIGELARRQSAIEDELAQSQRGYIAGQTASQGRPSPNIDDPAMWWGPGF